MSKKAPNWVGQPLGQSFSVYVPNYTPGGWSPLIVSFKPTVVQGGRAATARPRQVAGRGQPKVRAIAVSEGIFLTCYIPSCKITTLESSGSMAQSPFNKVLQWTFLVKYSLRFGLVGQFIIHEFLILFMTILSFYIVHTYLTNTYLV